MAHASHLYAVAIGSNRRHGRYGAPAMVAAAAMRRIDKQVGTIIARSATLESAPLGPSRRRYANAVVLLGCAHPPLKLLAELQKIERRFGRRRGRRWGARVLDLDVILWSGGVHASADLLVPHPRWRERAFVAGPLATIAPDWRDPVTNLRVRHAAARLRRVRAVDPYPRSP